ncbi:von Willebrand factor A domain-containing protein 5A-like isoform X2 [Lepisosteus oculatus]
MADPMLMLSLFPEFPIAETTLSSNGEFIFLMDCSGSMQNPMDRESGAQQRIESARDTLVLLLKSLPLGCHFNIYSFGSQYESFFPESVEYTQDSMESALKKVMVMQADMGGTEILFPLREIYKQPCQAAHPRQLFVFTDGEVSNTKEVIDLVRSHAFSHRCFTFGIGEGASSSLITGMARAGSGHPQFITGTDRLQSKVMQSLRFALQPVVKEISVCWDVPPGIKVSLLSPSPTMLFRGQRALLYAQLTGQCDSSAVGSVCLQYTLGDKSVKNELTFSLNSDMDSGLAIHRLGACTLIRFLEGQERERAQGKEKEVLNQRLIKLSTESGVSCSHTAFIAINKDNKQPVQGALLCRDIPGKRVECQFDLRCLSSLLSRDYNLFPEEPTTYSIEPLVFRDKPARLDTPNYRAARFYDPYASSEPVSKPKEDPMLMMITLQKANGSWELNKSVASVLGKTKKEVTSKMPKEALNTNIWATVLALLWLYGFKLDFKDEWHFVAMKAVSWIKSQSVALQTIEGTEGTATPYRWALLLLLVLCCVSLAAVIALSIFYFQNSRYSGEIKSDFRSAFQKADAQPTINLMKTKEVLQMAIKREEQRCKDILNRAQRKCKSSFVIQESNNSAIAGPEFITNLSIASMELKRSLIKAEEECIGAMNRSTQECLKSISQLHLELDSFHHVSDEEYMMSLTGSERSCQNILRTANQKCKLSLSKMHQDCLRNLSRADGMFESVLATEKKECIRNLTIADVRCRSSLNEVHWQCKTNVSIVNQQHKFNLSNQETWFKRIIDKKEEAYSASLLQAKQECQVNLNKSHLECQTSISEEQLQCKSHLSKTEQVYSMSVQEAKQDCERNFSQAQQKRL